MKKTISLFVLLVLVCGLCGCNGSLVVRSVDTEEEGNIPIGICFIKLTEEEFNGTWDDNVKNFAWDDDAKVEAFGARSNDELLIPVVDGKKDFTNITTSDKRKVYMSAMYIEPDTYTSHGYFSRRVVFSGGLYGSSVTFNTKNLYGEDAFAGNEFDYTKKPEQTIETSTLEATGYTNCDGGAYYMFYIVYERSDGTLYIKHEGMGTEYFSGQSMSLHKVLTSDVSWEGDDESLKNVDVTVTIEARPKDMSYELSWLDADNNPVGGKIAWTMSDEKIPELTPPAGAAWVLLHETGTGRDNNTVYKLDEVRGGASSIRVVMDSGSELFQITNITIP